MDAAPKFAAALVLPVIAIGARAYFGYSQVEDLRRIGKAAAATAKSATDAHAVSSILASPKTARSARCDDPVAESA
jgi:hypothetical protein